MGCTGSKQNRRDRCLSSSQQCVRSYSLPVHDIGSAAAAVRLKGDHVVSLTSSTLGSLRLEYDDALSSFDFSSDEEMMKSNNDNQSEHQPAEIPPEKEQHLLLRKKKAEVIERAKAWSEMIERRTPKTLTITSLNEPETINAWELMAGLEDVSPVHRLQVGGERRAYSFNTTRDAFFRLAPTPEPVVRPPYKLGDAVPSSEHPQWMQLSEEDSAIISEFDPEILSSFRMALDELSPEHPPEPEKPSYTRKSWSSNTSTATRESREVPKSTGIVRERVSAFQQKIDAQRATRLKGGTAEMAPCCKCPPDGRERVILYFTSLRGVRKTFEDCRTIKVVLRGYGVRVEERDVSMHAGFKAELIDLLGPGYGLPRVFADGNYLGGAEEVRHLHEAGELSQLLEGCEAAPVGKGVSGEMMCQVCGDMRFLPCKTCSGSCKVYVEVVVEEEEEEEEEEGEEHFGGFRRCPDCNENGLVRCPLRC